MDALTYPMHTLLYKLTVQLGVRSRTVLSTVYGTEWMYEWNRHTLYAVRVEVSTCSIQVRSLFIYGTLCSAELSSMHPYYSLWSCHGCSTQGTEHS